MDIPTYSVRFIYTTNIHVLSFTTHTSTCVGMRFELRVNYGNIVEMSTSMHNSVLLSVYKTNVLTSSKKGNK